MKEPYELGDLDTRMATYSSAFEGNEMYPAISNLAMFTREPRLPCHLLDSLSQNHDFHGREDILDILKAKLLPSRKKPTSAISDRLKQFALCGIDGIGKTEIAREFARRHRDEFDAVFWVPADEIKKLDRSFVSISLGLGLERPKEKLGHIASRELVKEWLSNPLKARSSEATLPPAEAKWLIIFDNADDPYMLSDYWPTQSSGSGSVLITSRDPIAKSLYVGSIQGLDLHPLSDEDASGLLCKLIRDTENNQLSRKIAHSLGGIPIAITQAAGIIRKKGLTFPQFRKSYGSDPQTKECRLMGTGLHQGPCRCKSSCIWAFDDLSPEARALLLVLSVLDHDCIPEFMVGTVKVDLLITKFPNTPDSYEKARDELVQASLVKWNKDLEQLSIHRLVQESFKATMKFEPIYDAFYSAVELLRTHWPNMKSAAAKVGVQTDEWATKCSQTWESLYPHILKLKRQYQNCVKLQEIPDLNFGWLLLDAAWWQFEKGQLRNFESFFELAQDMCKNSHHSLTSSLLVQIHLTLGAIASETNNPRVSRYHKERSFELQKATYRFTGDEDICLCECYDELAIADIQDGQCNLAIEELWTSFDMHNKLGSCSSLAEANLGLAYTLQGGHDAANQVLEAALLSLSKEDGKTGNVSFRTGRILHALGNLREAQGLHPESFNYHQRALTEFRSTLGDHHHRVADLCHKVGKHFQRLNQPDQALFMTTQALRIWETNANLYRQEIARTSFLKAAILRIMGDERNAETDLARAYALRDEILGIRTFMTVRLQEVDFDLLVAFWSR